MGGVNHQHIHPGFNKCHRSFPGIWANPNRGTNQQSTGTILGGVRVLLALVKVFDGNEALELSSIINQRKFLDAVLCQKSHGLIWINSSLANNQWHRSHHIFNECGGALHLKHKPHVSVGHNANQDTILIHYRKSRNSVVATKVINLLDGCIRCRGNRVRNHAGFGSLYQINLTGLLINR